MYDSPNYPPDPALIEAYVAGQRHGTLIATPPDGHPQISLLPFLKQGDEIEVHCVVGDPTLTALEANRRATFLVSDFLAWSPHDWVDERDAGRATLHFRAVAFECVATVSHDPADVAAALARLTAAYEPQSQAEPLGDNAYYGARLRRLAAVRLQVVGMKAKFKTGPAGSDEIKRRVAQGLRERSDPGDARAADVIESYLG